MALRITVIKDNEEIEVKHFLDSYYTDEYNSIFHQDSAVKTGFNLGLRIPVEGNEMTFDMRHLEAIQDRNFYYTAKIYGADGKVLAGSLSLENIITEKGVQFFDTNYINSDYNVLINNKTLRDLDTTIDDLGNTGAAIASEMANINTGTVEWDGSGERYYFPVMINSKLDSKAINPWSQASQSFIHNDAAFTSDKHCVPQVYALEVLRRCFTSFGYTPTASDDVIEFLKNKLVGGMRSIGDTGLKYMSSFGFESDIELTDTLTAITFEKLLFDFNTDTNNALPSAIPYNPPLTDFYYNSFFIKFGPTVSSSLNFYDHTNTFLATITPVEGEWMQVSFAPSYTAAVTGIGIKAECPSGETCDILAESFMTFLPDSAIGTPVAWQRWQGELSLVDHLPKLPIKEFLLAVKNTWNIAIDVDSVGRTANIYFADDQLQGTVVDAGAISIDRSMQAGRRAYVKMGYTQNEVDTKNFYLQEFSRKEDVSPVLIGVRMMFYITQLNTYFIYNSDSELEPLGVKFSKYNEGNIADDAKEVSFYSELKPMDELIYNTEKFYATYTTEELSEKRGGRLFENDWPLFFTIKRGMQGGSVDDYPYASTCAFSWGGQQYDEDLTILPDLKNAIYTKWHQWLPSMVRNEMLKVSHFMIPGIDYGRWRSILRINGLNYLISRLRRNCMDSTAPAELELKSTRK